MIKVKLEDIENILLSTFSDFKKDKPIINLQLGDIDEWDSLGNFNLLLAIVAIISGFCLSPFSRAFLL